MFNPVFLRTPPPAGWSLDVDLSPGDPYLHTHLWQNHAPLRQRYHLLNDVDSSSKILSVRQAFFLCNKTLNFTNYNFAPIKFLILLIGHARNAGLKSRLGR
jgi:hypothetical protein